MNSFEQLSPSTKTTIDRIYNNSGIDYRYSCIEDFVLQPSELQFFSQNPTLKPTPTTHDRNKKYQFWSKQLATTAAQNALGDAGLEPQELTHLIVVTCTGFFAPGVDIHLIQSLGLQPTIDRTIVGFMGCHGALNGLKLAHSFCQSNDKAKVLLVCVELCSLHFQLNDTVESVVINAIFGDGCAAAILCATSPEQAEGKLAYKASHSQVLDYAPELMHWAIGDHGFLMGLSPKVTQVIGEHLPDYISDFLAQCGLLPETIDFWAIHPGGRKIVEKVQSVLSLTKQQLDDSFEVLRLFGNMSSPTILFILQRLLQRQRTEPLPNSIALAFGPGLSIESCLFQQVT